MAGLESSRNPRCLPYPELAIQAMAKKVSLWEADLIVTAEDVFGHMSSDEDDDDVGVDAVAAMKKPAGIEPLNLSESSSSSDENSSSSESGSSDSEDSIMAETAARGPLIDGLERASEASAQRKMRFLRSIESNGVLADNGRRDEKKTSTKQTRRPTRKSRNSSGMPRLLCQNVLGVRRSARPLVRRSAPRNNSGGEDSHSEEERFPSGVPANRSSFFRDPGLRKNGDENESKREIARDVDADKEDGHADKRIKLLRTNQLRMMKMSSLGRSIAQFGIHPSTNPFLFAAVCTQNVLSFWKITQDDYHPGLFAKSDVLTADTIPVGFPGAGAPCDVTWMGFHPAKPDFLLMTTSHGQVVPYSLEKTNYRKFHREWRTGTQNYRCADFSGPDTLLVGTTHGVVREIDTRSDHPMMHFFEKGKPHEVHYSHDIAAVSVHPEKPHLWAVAAEGEDLRTGRSERPGYLLDSRFPSEPVAFVGKDIVDFAFSPSGKFLAARKLPNTSTGAASSVVFYGMEDLMRNPCTWTGAVEDVGCSNPSWNVDVDQLGAIDCPRRPGRLDIQAIHPGCWVPETDDLYLVGQPRSEMIKIFKPTGLEAGCLDYATSLLRHGNGRVFGSSRIAATMVRHHQKTSMVACTVRDHLIYFADKDLY